MITELEEQFFKVFGVEPIPIKSYGYWLIKGSIAENDKGEKVVYPEITDRKLLEMICIYNSFQNDDASLFIPFDINNVKDIALQVITKSIKDKTLNNYYCNDVEKLKAKIQQLFKENQ